MPDFHAVAEHVETLYRSTDPVLITQLQKMLQELQRSRDGYRMAQFLLQLPSLNCRYFGALTYAVVILTNAEGHAGLLGEMLAKIRDFGALPDHRFVVRKLMLNIALLYIKHSDFDPVRAFLEAQGENIDPCTLTAYNSLSRDTLPLLLAFLTVLVEDVAKLNDFRAPVHRSLRATVFPCLQAVYGFLNETPDIGAEVRQKALECLASVMAYVPDVQSDITDRDVKVLVQFLLHTLFVLHTDQSLCLLVFNEILELNATLILPEDKKVLYENVCGEWGQNYVKRGDISPFVDLFLTILQLTCVRLLKTIMKDETMAVLSFALQISDFSGVPCIEDVVSERMLLFWEDFAAVFEDSPEMFAELEAEPGFRERKNDIFTKVSQVYWKKAHLPDPETYADIYNEFNVYRSNVSDFFIVLYSLLKLELYETMVELLINCDIATLPQNLGDVDATMYLLFKINDDSVYFELQAAPLARLTLRLFESPFVGGVQASMSYMQDAHLLTFVKYLSSTEFFLKTKPGHHYLPQAFGVLLPIVQAPPQNILHVSLTLLALKSIIRICDECLPYLVAMLPELEAISVRMLRDPAYDALVRLRMFNAYSVVAQNLADLGEYAALLHSMIETIAGVAAATLKEQDTVGEVQEDYVISLLSCLVNIAKGCSRSDEVVESMTDVQRQQYRAFWQADPAQIKPLLASIIHEFSFKYEKSGQALVIEKCAAMIKLGLGEQLGGPFEMALEVVVEYCVSLMQVLAAPHAPQILAAPHVFGLMQCLISINYTTLEPGQVQALLLKTIVQKLAEIRQDPDVVKASLDVCCTILEKRPGLLVFFPDLAKILEFLLTCLHANEASVVKTALRFWALLILLKKGTQEDAQYVTEMFETVGPIFTENLLLAFLQGPRLHMDHFYQTFRGLIGKYPVYAKIWLSNALNHVKLAEKDASLFVHRLMVTRGRRTANDVLQLLWLDVNGMIKYS